MKKYSIIKFLCSPICLSCVFFVLWSNSSASATGRNTPVFIENIGQWPDSVLFVCNTGSQALWFTYNGVHHRLARIDTSATRTSSLRSKLGAKHPVLGKFGATLPQLEFMTVSAKFEGTNPNVKVLGASKQKQYYNFYKGRDRSKWKSHVPCFESIIYEDIYPGINLSYYSNGNKIEYDFMVSPTADPSQIRIAYQGAKSVQISKKGKLIVGADWGEIIESKPKVYQMKGGRRKVIDASFNMLSENMIGFKVSKEYDKSKKLIIDPVLSYSTYFGTVSGQIALSIDLDSQGNMLISGLTGPSFPTFKAFDSVGSGGQDAFISKISASGHELIFSTYLGGDEWELFSNAKTDTFDNIYVAGITLSPNFPALIGYDTTFDGIKETGFLCKFTPGCDSMIYSTFVGGSDFDFLVGLDVDNDGFAYVTGLTTSTDLVFEYSYIREYMNRGDGFLVKVSPDGQSPVFGTYLGGYDNSDFPFGIAVDDSGNAFVTGYTTSNDFPSTDPSDTIMWNAGYDAFVQQISTNDSSLVYSVRFGSTGDDEGLDIKLDKSGDAYVTGRAFGRGFPLMNAYDSTPNGGGDLFVSKFQKSTGNLLFSTYMGSRSWDDSYCIGVDNEHRVWIAGDTWEDNFPTVDAFDNTFNGRIDAFVACLSASGSELLYSTYLGGNEWDGFFGMVIDASNNVYLAGRTQSLNYPTIDPYQAELGGHWDVVIAKFSPVATSIDDSAGSTLPAKFVISNNYPNPFNPSTTISYSLPERSHTQIVVYNILGEEVIKLVDQVKSAGSYTVTWNGMDRNGKVSATGVYFYQLVTENYRESKKMLLLK